MGAVDVYLITWGHEISQANLLGTFCNLPDNLSSVPTCYRLKFTIIRGSFLELQKEDLELSWDISLAEASSRSLSLQESSRGSFSWRSWISRFLELFSDCRSQSILGFLASLKSSSSRKISRSSLVHQQWSRCRSCNHFLLQPFLASSWLIFPCAQFFSLVHSSFGFTF